MVFIFAGVLFNRFGRHLHMIWSCWWRNRIQNAYIRRSERQLKTIYLLILFGQLLEKRNVFCEQCFLDLKHKSTNELNTTYDVCWWLTKTVNLLLTAILSTIVCLQWKRWWWENLESQSDFSPPSRERSQEWKWGQSSKRCFIPFTSSC